MTELMNFHLIFFSSSYFRAVFRTGTEQEVFLLTCKSPSMGTISGKLQIDSNKIDPLIRENCLGYMKLKGFLALTSSFIFAKTFF